MTKTIYRVSHHISKTDLGHAIYTIKSDIEKMLPGAVALPISIERVDTKTNEIIKGSHLHYWQFEKYKAEADALQAAVVNGECYARVRFTSLMGDSEKGYSYWSHVYMISYAHEDGRGLLAERTWSRAYTVADLGVLSPKESRRLGLRYFLLRRPHEYSTSVTPDQIAEGQALLSAREAERANGINSDRLEAEWYKRISDNAKELDSELTYNIPDQFASAVRGLKTPRPGSMRSLANELLMALSGDIIHFRVVEDARGGRLTPQQAGLVMGLLDYSRRGEEIMRGPTDQMLKSIHDVVGYLLANAELLKEVSQMSTKYGYEMRGYLRTHNRQGRSDS